MSDRRTFLGNAAAAAFIAKFSPLRSFGFTSDGPQTIRPTISDREKAGLRGPVKQLISGVQDGAEVRFSQTTEYDPDGRILSTSRGSTDDGWKWVTTNTYDENGRLTKTISGNGTEPGTETVYAYDEAGRLLSITKSGKEVGSKSEFHYDEQGRKTAVRHFDTDAVKRQAMYTVSPWDDPAEGWTHVPAGGNITTIYDGNDQPTEAQIRDGEGRIVSRFVRTYDANGRILEEKHIMENPFLLIADWLAERPQFNELNAAQLEGMNTAMKLMLGGSSGAGITYQYDAQGRVAEMRGRNAWWDKVTTISYNEHGDQTAKRSTMTPADSVVTGCSMDSNGTIIPRTFATEPTFALPRENEVRYEYEYDSYGNWTQQTENRSYGPDKLSYVRHRKLTYY